MTIIFTKEDAIHGDLSDSILFIMAKFLEDGQTVEFNCEKERKGIWDAQRQKIREPLNNNVPWGIMGILTVDQSWIKIEVKIKNAILNLNP